MCVYLKENMYSFSPERCLKLNCVSLHVCFPLCFVGNES